MIVSTGFKSRILGTEGFTEIFTRSAIFIFSGTRPASADDADSTGTLLGIVSWNGLPWDFTSTFNGLTFFKDGPYVLKDPSQNWVLNPTNSGIASWFRLYSADPGDLRQTGYTFARIDGDIAPQSAPGDAEMVFESTTVVAGHPVVLDYFLYTILPVA